jgi:leucyl aminopeptidase
MEFQLTNDRPQQVDAAMVVVGVYDERVLSSAGAAVDEACDGRLKALLESGDVPSRLAAVTVLHGLPGLKAPRVMLVGLGEQKKFDAGRFVRVLREAAKQMRGLPAASAAVYLSEVDVPGRDANWRAQQCLLAVDYGCYRYDRTYKARPEPAKLKHVMLPANGVDSALPSRAEAIAAGVRLTRELGNLPPNICNPAYLAEEAGHMADRHPALDCEVLERAQMQALGMGSLLAVAQGSANAPKLIVLRYHGAAKDKKPYVLVGKGITFDTGGISLKPGAGMEEMKFDMCGAGTVFGVMEAVNRLKLPINLVGVVAAVENMPDGHSYRPSDVVTTMSGLTVEVLNTDAEGRLILCDAITYARRFEPAAMVDIATLTGACVVALGNHASGLMSRDEELSSELLAAGESSFDRAWRLPLWEDYQSQLESGFADLANIGGKWGGAITAGCFLARFTEGLRWAHLDIAGSAWDSGRKGTATGRPVGLLVDWLSRQG